MDRSEVGAEIMTILLTIEQAAEAIQMSSGWIRKAIRDGELQCVRLGKLRGVRIRPEDLVAYVDLKIEGTAIAETHRSPSRGTLQFREKSIGYQS